MTFLGNHSCMTRELQLHDIKLTFYIQWNIIIAEYMQAIASIIQVNENAITWLLFLVFEFKRQWLWRVAPWFGGLGRLVVLEEFLVVVTVTRFRDGHLCYRSWGKLSLSLHWGAPWGRADRGRFRPRYFPSVLGCSW